MIFGVKIQSMFEIHLECLILILAFSTNFCPIKTDLSCLVTLFDRKLQVFKNRQNGPFLAFLMYFCPLNK